MTESQKPDYVLTALVGTNADLFPHILNLYSFEGAAIADVTYGKGVFWKNVDTTLYDFWPSDILTGTDMRSLPYKDSSFDMVVIDPPYMHTPGTVKKSISAGYKVNELASSGVRRTGDVIALYMEGMAEAHRILKKKSFMVVKCQDGIESGKQHWNHITLYGFATGDLVMYAKDLFVLVQQHRPAIRWKHQLHARKNHSYFWVFQKG